MADAGFRFADDQTYTTAQVVQVLGVAQSHPATMRTAGTHSEGGAGLCGEAGL